jgi:O-antigen/teichoic acid export membrane protein
MSAFSLAHVRRSLIYFTLGKGLGIILGIGLLLVLVRVLEVNDYKFYLISQAFLIIVNQFSSLGIEQTAQRYLPELLSRSEGRTLYNLTSKLCYLRILVLIIIAVLIYPFISTVTDALNIQNYQFEFKLFLLVMVFELFARFLDIVFESFMLQGVSQISMLLRTGFRLVPMVWLTVISVDNRVDLEQWILIDIIASVIGCLWGIINLWKYLKDISHKKPGNNHPIEYVRYSSFSFPIYIAGTIMLLSSQDTIRLIAANILNSVDFASFGFAATLVYMLNRYLPMTLLVGMVRPLLVDAREKPDYQVRLPKIAGLLFKLNMFTLMPIIAFVFVFSEEISLILTGGRYPGAANYMLAFIPILILQTLRFITSLTALAMESARVTLIATILSLIGLIAGVVISQYIDDMDFVWG